MWPLGVNLVFWLLVHYRNLWTKQCWNGGISDLVGRIDNTRLCVHIHTAVFTELHGFQNFKNTMPRVKCLVFNAGLPWPRMPSFRIFFNLTMVQRYTWLEKLKFWSFPGLELCSSSLQWSAADPQLLSSCGLQWQTASIGMLSESEMLKLKMNSLGRVTMLCSRASICFLILIN